LTTPRRPPRRRLPAPCLDLVGHGLYRVSWQVVEYQQRPGSRQRERLGPAAPANPSIEEMLTIDPLPATVIGSITAFMPSQQPTAFTSRIHRKSASGMSAMLANFSTPALLTSTSSWPNASTAVPTAAAQSASLVTSWWMYRQDSALSPAATAAPGSSSTSPKTTRAPSDTKWRTCDLPIPRAPPVISATLPSSRPMVPHPVPKPNACLVRG
jgi:hypothetical protein